MRIDELFKGLSKGQLLVVLSLIFALALSPISKAATSIFTGLAGAGFLLRLFEGSLIRRDFLNIRYIPLWILLLLQLIDEPLHGGGLPDVKMLGHWLPLVLIPLSIRGIPNNHALWRSGFLLVSLVFGYFAVGSSVNYFFNKEEINSLLLQSKHVPLTTGMHHIYFGLYLAALIWVSIFFAGASKNGRSIWLLTGTVLLICLHVLSSRTGLLGLYASMAAIGLYYLRRNKSVFKLKWLLPAIILPVLAFAAIPSLRYKWLNSVEDLRALNEGGKELNFKSFGMRVESWKAGIAAIGAKPWIGSGNGSYKQKIQLSYTEINTPLIPENRIEPHNQFIESWVRQGALSFLSLLVLFALPFKFGNKQSGIPGLPIWILFVFAFVLESVLQRQMGVLLFSSFYYLFVLEPNISDR